MKNYSNMSQLELEHELQTLQEVETRYVETDLMAPAVPTLEDMQCVIHELQVHQVELEMQNREVRETREQLEVTVDRYADLYDFAPVGFLSLDHRGTIREINLTAAAMFGMERPLLLGKPLIAFLAKSDIDRFIVHLRQCVQQGGEKVVTEVDLTVRGGGVISVRLESLPIHGADSQATTFRTALIDITARKRAEEKLRESEARFRQMADAAPVMIWMSDTDKLCDYFNKPWCDFTGRTLEQELGDGWADGVHPDELERCLETYTTSFDARRDFRMEYRLRRYDGKYRWVLDIGVPRLTPDGHFAGYIGSCIDITDRKQAEEKLIEQAALLDHARDAILVCGLDDRILFWNQGAERIYGWTSAETVGVDPQELIFRGDSSQFEEAKRTVIERGEWDGELRHVTKDGREVVVESRCTLVRDAESHPKSILAINTDVTEQKKLEAQFLRAQRLESIGTLASGVAHDLNNILSPILTAAQMLQMKIADEGSKHLLDLMVNSAQRGGTLVEQILSFARGVEGQRTTLQPKHLIREIVRVLSETFPKDITLKHSLPSDLATINCDPTQLHQVLMNLCVNARDAMPQGGTLTIALENIVFDEHYARMNPEAKPGPYVLITITDTGTGISPEILDRIFDPFFTTKEQGNGAGLGLSTVLRIVKGHGGFIDVYSEPGKGAKFSIYLRAVASMQTEETIAAASNMLAGQGEMVLVVDDESSVRETARTTLESFGYRALTAQDGTEAIALYVAHKGEIEIVLIDMMMPVMDGLATIRALQRIDPQVKVVLSSGSARSERVGEAARLGIKTFLPKPYTAEKLLKVLGEVIAASVEKARNT